MLDDAVGAFLDTVSERALDEPLLALLRSLGFSRVTLTHGQAEFGKDIVARRDGEQWAFQSKAGDIGVGSWRRLTGQLDDLRLSDYAGPEFDRALPRHPVLVTTGRLVGNAPLSATEYNERARSRGEPELEVWTRDDLLSLMAGNPDALLRGSIDGALMTVLGAIERHDISMDSIEHFARRWDAFPPDHLVGLGVVEAALVCERLKQANRLDLACHLALCFVRAAWAGRRDVEYARIAADAGGTLFETYARDLWTGCDERLLRKRGIYAESGFSAWMSYPVRCMRLAELLALLGLRVGQSGDSLAEEIASWLARLMVVQPGVAHPIGDRYAVSLVPPIVLMRTNKPKATRRLLTRTAVWVSDRYERGELGLAGSSASPEEETARVFGSAFEHVHLKPRRLSLVAAVTLDLAALCRFQRAYGDIRNDYLAVGIVPAVLRCPDEPDQYTLPGDANRWELNPAYPDELPRRGRLGPPHHDEKPEARQLMREDRPWDLLAVSSALRDRYFVSAIEALLHDLAERGQRS